MCRRYLVSLWLSSWTMYFFYMIVIYPAFMSSYWGPYLLRHWHEAECTVTHITTYQMPIEQGFKQQEFLYTSLQVQVNLTNLLIPGFACGNPEARSEAVKQNRIIYPTEYVNCPDPHVCDRQQLLPLWTCAECHRCDEFLGRPQTCLWRLVEPEGVEMKDPSKWPGSYSAPFPMPGTAYIHVILGDSVYYPLSELIGLQIAGFTGIFIPPVLFFFWMRKKYRLRRIRQQAAVLPQVPQPPPPPAPLPSSSG